MTRDELAVLDRVCGAAVDDGRDAARHVDHGVAALRGVLDALVQHHATSDRAYVFGFVAGLSQVWEGIELQDFLED